MYRAVAAPYLFGSLSEGRITVRGETAQTFGHKLPGRNGASDGVYAEWTWIDNTLRVQNDRYGFFPLFYYAKGAEIAVSPSIATLIANGADPELDDASVALFLRLGQFIGDDTAFRYIRCLPPNASLVWDRDGVRLSSARVCVTEDRSISQDDAIRRYVELFAAAIRRRLPRTPRFAVPLSGGRDSRHILFELKRAGFAPQLCATAVQYPDDAAVAALLAAELGLRHVVVHQEQDFFDAEVKKNDFSNFGVDEGTWHLLLADLFEREGIDTVYDGVGGDVLSAGLFLSPERDRLFRGGDLARIVDDLLPDTEALLDLLLSRQSARRWSRELAAGRLADEARQHLDAHNPVTSFFFWNRTRRRIAVVPYSMLGRSLTVFAPYLDHDLFDFLASLPARLLIDHSFHTEAILSGYPSWRHIRFEDKKVPDLKFSAQNARFAHRFSEALGFVPRSDWVRRTSLAVRLARAKLDPGYAASLAWYLRPAVWLLQLESLAQSGGERSDPGSRRYFGRAA